jgi:hypothetical protein
VGWKRLEVTKKTVTKVMRAASVSPEPLMGAESRFEHSLGVATVASKVFDALMQRQQPLDEVLAHGIVRDHR